MAERVIPPITSLVKYDNPVLVTKHPQKKPAAKPQLEKPSPAVPSSSQSAHAKSALFSASDQRETEDALNFVLPPREWEEDGQLWRQQVSSTPAKRIDVINLEEELDMRLQQRQAREMGICPIRRELYTQCFDELIRQVTINCAERGMLLLRIRDEIRMTISAYQVLYESSIAFGIRKALMAEHGKAELEENVMRLEKEKADLEKQVMELQSHADQIKRRSNEQTLAEEKKHAEEIEQLKKTNQQLKAQLEGIIAPKK